MLLSEKMKSLINYSTTTFKSNNPEDTQSNARKSIEAFCKIIILHHYGDKRGKNIIYAQDNEWNKKFKITARQKKEKRELVLNMLEQIVVNFTILNTCYKAQYEGKILSKVVKAKREYIKRHLAILVYGGNSSSHESSPMIMTRNDMQIAKSILKELLYWLFDDFLKCDTPDELLVYLDKYDIFLSYRSCDELWVKVLQENLEAHGYKLFVDSYQMIAGENIEQRLEDAIAKSKSAVVIYPKEDDSKWITKELAWMQKRKKEDSSFNIISIVMHTSAHMPSEEFVYVDFTKNKYDKAFNHLLTSLKGVPPSKNYITAELKIPSDKEEPNKKDEAFVQEVIETLEYEKLVKLFYQEYTEIDFYYREIEKRLKERFKENYYPLSIPSYSKSKKYFAHVAKRCGIENKVRELQEWKDAMEERLESGEEMFLLVRNLEQGNDKCNLEFASTLRSLKAEYSNLYVLLVGHKGLAKLVFKANELSPLRSVGETLFFPNHEIKMDAHAITLEFENQLENREHIAELLKRETVKIFSYWSSDKLINQFFWKNLLVEKEGYFVWRSENIRAIGREIVNDILLKNV